MGGSQQEGFAFVMQDPNKEFSKETQTMIRKQAMRAVGASRRRSNRSSSNSSPLSPLSSRASQKLDLPPPSPLMPFSGMELLVKDSGLDPMDLSALTSVHIGAIAGTILSAEPSRLRDVLICRQKSYFSYIPSLFGHALVLDDAIRCLLTVAHSMLVPDHKPGDRKILFYYGKALRSLQSAVNDPYLRCSPEVLCATAVLALFELLNSPTGRTWGRHIAGASDLIQCRGPSRFTSDLDKTLFVSLSFPICAEALLNNERCFLEEPAWAETFLGAIVPEETFTDRSRLNIEVMMIKCKIPGLAKRTNHMVITQDHVSAEDLARLVADIRQLRTSVIAWRRRFNSAMMKFEDCSHHDTMDYGKRYEVLGLSLVVNIMTTRLLLCVELNGREYLEEEVQHLALELKNVQESIKDNRRAELFLAQKAKFADAALATHCIFAETVKSGKIVESWRLETFFKVLGRRKVCDGQTCCEFKSREEHTE